MWKASEPPGPVRPFPHLRRRDFAVTTQPASAFSSDRSSSNRCGVTLMNNQNGHVVADVMRTKEHVTVTDYPSILRLQEAAEGGDSEAVQKAADSLVRTIKGEAQKIQEKYLDPPGTTDFGIMFLATEGLYAEALRQPGLVSELQQRWRVVIAGPTTLAAILSSLRMGFQTLAIEKRASEVWEVLGAVKTEFGKFGDVLDRVKKQLSTASRTQGSAASRRAVFKSGSSEATAARTRSRAGSYCFFSLSWFKSRTCWSSMLSSACTSETSTASLRRQSSFSAACASTRSLHSSSHHASVIGKRIRLTEPPLCWISM